ncbi:unnamed protein product [Camellia sinensis]
MKQRLENKRLHQQWRFHKIINILKISGLIFISLTFFYLGKHWSDSFYQLIFFNSRQTPLSSSKTLSPISLSPNLNKTFDLTLSDPTLPSIPPTSQPKPLSSPPHERFGIVDENGTMADDFEVGDFDPSVVDNWGSDIKAEVVEDGDGGSRVVKKFGLCTESMREYIQCLDNTKALRRFNSTEKGERFERHCPEEGKGLNCLVSTPKGYRAPIPWPRSRDEGSHMLKRLQIAVREEVMGGKFTELAPVVIGRSERGKGTIVAHVFESSGLGARHESSVVDSKAFGDCLFAAHYDCLAEPESDCEDGTVLVGHGGEGSEEWDLVAEEVEVAEDRPCTLWLWGLDKVFVCGGVFGYPYFGEEK